MEYIILIIFLVLIVVLLKIICKVNIKKIETIAENKSLDEKVKKYPSNTDICKKILKKLNNEKVVVEEDENAKSCLYIVTTNKIIIGDTRQSFTRIQTIAHECLHSIQDKRLLMFNFIYANMYLLTFLILCVFSIFDILPCKMLFISLYILIGFIFYFIRSFLEMDAMTKARFLAKEYMEDEKISDKEEINEIIEEYDKLNNLGIKATNYKLFVGVAIKIIILAIFMI